MTTELRQVSFSDRLIDSFDQGLRILTQTDSISARPNPGATVAESVLLPSERKHSGGLMRVDHTGEVCAQALYLGQALVTRNEKTREHLLQAAHEENDHLIWCAQRLRELNTHPSYLNLLWFKTSFLLGVIAGLSGDKWSLGFVAATEEQVEAHLTDHLEKLPAADERSSRILLQMRSDESQHGLAAMAAGGIELPTPIKSGMKLVAKVMTSVTYWI